MKFRTFLYVLLILIGLLQPIGYMTGVKNLRGLGMATASSPLPIVFTKVKGVETFALDFTLHLKDSKNHDTIIHLEPSVYSQLQGPYNRRNVYGAAFAYGPVLSDHIRTNILEYALCNDGVIVKELGIQNQIQIASLQIKEKTKGQNRTWIYKIKCDKR